MKSIIKKLFLIFITLLMNSCSSGGGSSDEQVTALDAGSQITLDSAVAIDTTFALQKSTVNVYQGDSDHTADVLEDVRRMSEKVDTMSDRVTTTIELSEGLVKTLAEDFSLNSAYSTQFSLNTSYDTNTPYFVMNAASTKNFLLLSSSTRLFVPKKTIKTYFNNPASLLVAWQRSMNNYTSGHLYMNIYEVQTDGTSQRVGNGVLIPADKMKSILNL